MRSPITQLAALEGEMNDNLSGHFVEVNEATLY
jgi:hypothetical protein